MVNVLPINQKVSKQIIKNNLLNKFNKQISQFKSDQYTKGLNLELLHPKKMGLYSFRIDNKFRAICIYRKDKKAMEILMVTNHYR